MAEINVDTLPNNVFFGKLLLQTWVNLGNLHIPRMINFYCKGDAELQDLQNAVEEYNTIPNRRAIYDSRILMLLGLNPDAYLDGGQTQLHSMDSIPTELVTVGGRLSYHTNDDDDYPVFEQYDWPWSALPLHGQASAGAFEHARTFLPFLPYTRNHMYGPGNTEEGSIDVESASTSSSRV